MHTSPILCVHFLKKFGSLSLSQKESRCAYTVYANGQWNLNYNLHTYSFIKFMNEALWCSWFTGMNSCTFLTFYPCCTLFSLCGKGVSCSTSHKNFLESLPTCQHRHILIILNKKHNSHDHDQQDPSPNTIYLLHCILPSLT